MSNKHLSDGNLARQMTIACDLIAASNALLSVAMIEAQKRNDGAFLERLQITYQANFDFLATAS